MDYKTAAQGKRYYNCAKWIDIDWIIEEYSTIIDYSHMQIMIQGIEGKDKFYGTGRLAQYPEKELEFKTFLHDTPYTNSVLDKLGMYRSRLMILNKPMVYSWHSDPTPRIHIPLISDHNTNFMVVQDEVIRMPVVNGAYWVDTTSEHTYVQTSTEPRVHIVGCVDD